MNPFLLVLVSILGILLGFILGIKAIVWVVNFKVSKGQVPEFLKVWGFTLPERYIKK